MKVEIFFNSYLIIKNVAGLLDPTTHVLLYEKKKHYCHPGVCVNEGLRLNSSCAMGSRLL